jgi:hypothetical protein
MLIENILAWASETESAFGSTFMPSAKSVQLIATHANNSGVIYLVNFSFLEF